MQSCDNPPRQGRTRYCKYPPQIIFRREHFPIRSRFRNARARHVPVGRAGQKFSGDFLRIRSELRHGHYGNNRSRISPAINSTSVCKPHIYDRKRCRRNTAGYCTVVAADAQCSANGRNNGRIKNRKIENETASCPRYRLIKRRDEEE